MEKLAALPVTPWRPRLRPPCCWAMLKPWSWILPGACCCLPVCAKKPDWAKVALVGMGHKFELWNAAAFEAETDAALAMPAEALAELGALSL